MKKKIVITLSEDGNTDIVGLDSLTKDEQKTVFDEIKKALELLGVVEEEPHEF